MRDARSREWGPKVVGISLEGEKYEPAARGSSNSLRARSNREEAGVRDREGCRARRTVHPRARGSFVCSHPLFVVLFKKLASSPRLSVPADIAALSRAFQDARNKREGNTGHTYESTRHEFCIFNNLYTACRNKTRNKK